MIVGTVTMARGRRRSLLVSNTLGMSRIQLHSMTA
jgi:hypothetical protein